MSYGRPLIRRFLRRSHYNSLSNGVKSYHQLGTAIDVSNQYSRSTRSSGIESIMSSIDSDNVKAMFGYGSGVMPQDGYGDSKPQVDVIIIAENTKEFHKANLARFPSHYSAIKALGIDSIQKVQNWGAGVYFNPYVSMSTGNGSERMVKYGVISYENAKKDICEWSSMYIAGRLQKPVRHYKIDDSLLAANQFNLSSAFNLALLLSDTPHRKKSLLHLDLFHSIVLLSYMGDPRMLIGGENPNKAKNIVTKQKSEIRSLYHPFIRNALKRNVLRQVEESNFNLLLSTHSKAELLSELPHQFKKRLFEIFTSYRDRLRCEVSGNLTNGQNDELLELIANDNHLIPLLVKTVRKTICEPALKQSIKGLATAGLLKSGKYAWEKKIKSWK